jgi:hypothetical protein
MIKLIFRVAFIVIALLSLAACAKLVPAPPKPTVTISNTAAPDLLSDRGRFFAASGVCAMCHTKLTDSQGHDVSFDTMWRSAMMANSARDPYWQAGLRREVLNHPAAADFIQDKCATCHMPMARTTINLSSDGEDYAVVFGATGLNQPTDPNHNLAMDSISCALCHQIGDVNLGAREGTSGHYTIDKTASADSRLAYGPFTPNPDQVALMQAASGFVQTQSAHIQTAELCASCHELYTESFDATSGELRPDEFPEQMPYNEWQHSVYSGTKTCEICHMPVAAGQAPVSSVGNPAPAPRQVYQHIFVGGNSYLPRILQQFGSELDVTSSAAQFQNTINLTRQQLQNDTATVELKNLLLADGTLSLDTVVQNKAGHKLPSAYPSRRAWLHLTVRDANQQIVFESGAYNPDGSIVGNDNDANALQYEPHHDVVTKPDQVQIYEAIMGDTTGKPTTVLLLAATYLKDNRLLPDGFDKTTAPPQIAVHGEAAADANFFGGSDRVTYQIAVGQAAGPFTVEVELMYQTLSFRWADNLRQYDDPAKAPEIRRFLKYYAAVPNQPEQIAKSNATVK